MPVVTVQMLAGRSDEQRRKIVDGITRVMKEAAGAAPEATTVIIHEVERDRWASAGRLLSERS